MCDYVDENRDWLIYIHHMIEYGERVLSYTEGMNQDDFVQNGLTYDAVLRNLEIMGQSARNVPEQVRQAHPEIAWSGIIGTRNRLAHDYLGIDDDIIWDIVHNNLPELLPKLQTIIDEHKAPQP